MNGTRDCHVQNCIVGRLFSERENGRFVVIGTAPEQTLDAQCLHIARINAALSKCFDKGNAIVEIIILDRVKIRRDNGAKKFAERNVDRRTIIERTDTHREHVCAVLRPPLLVDLQDPDELRPA